MGIGESVKKGFSVATQSMALVFCLFAFGVFWSILNLLYTSKFQTPAQAPSPIVIALAVVFILLSIYMQAGSLGFVLNKIKQGNADLSSFAAAAGKFYLRVLLLGLFVAVIAGAFILLAGLGVAFLQTPGMVIAVVLGGIGIYVLLLMFLSPYILVAEDNKVIASIKKSVAFVRKNILAVLGISLILVAIGFAAGVILGLVYGAITLVLKAGTASQIIFAVLSSFLNAFLGVFVTAGFMNYYLANSNNTGGAGA